MAGEVYASACELAEEVGRGEASVSTRLTLKIREARNARARLRLRSLAVTEDEDAGTSCCEESMEMGDGRWSDGCLLIIWGRPGPATFSLSVYEAISISRSSNGDGLFFTLSRPRDTQVQTGHAAGGATGVQSR